MSDSDEEIIDDEKMRSKGSFDKQIDYSEIKKKLIDEYNKIMDNINKIDENTKESKSKILHNRLIYCLVCMIQLKNGSRCIEACKAIKIFFKKGNFNNIIEVKIAKSESTKVNRKTGKKFVTNIRMREMNFPHGWIFFKLTQKLKDYLSNIRISDLKQRVLNFMIREFNGNTHSLRYAFINYMLYEKKIDMGIVAKYVGHSNLSQLITYTSKKNATKLHTID